MILSSHYTNVPACGTFWPRFLNLSEADVVLRHLVGGLAHRLVGQPSDEQVGITCGLVAAEVQQSRVANHETVAIPVSLGDTSRLVVMETKDNDLKAI